MNIKFLMLSLLLTGAILAGCGNTEDAEEHGNHNNPSEDEIRSLDVDLEVPETASTGETVEFTAHVHSNGEDVTDADQVMFEVQEDEEMIEASHSENGLYTIEYTFDEAGEYTVISHVDAFQLHTMPQSEITVE